MKKIAMGCLGVSILFVMVVALLGWVLFFRELPALDASLSLPSEVALDSELTIVVTATNPHDEPIILDSIDIDDSFLSGFQVVAIDPEPSDTLHVAFVNQRSWEFSKTVPAGESFSVSFTLKAVTEGHFSGDVDVCNPNQDFTTLIADVVVRKELSNEAVDSDKE